MPLKRLQKCRERYVCKVCLDRGCEKCQKDTK